MKQFSPSSLFVLAIVAFHSNVCSCVFQYTLPVLQEKFVQLRRPDTTSDAVLWRKLKELIDLKSNTYIVGKRRHANDLEYDDSLSEANVVGDAGDDNLRHDERIAARNAKALKLILRV